MKLKFSRSCGFLFFLPVLISFPAFAGGRWLVLPSGWGQQPDPAAEERARQYQEKNREIVRAREERMELRRSIDTTLQKIGPDAYRKYSDGTIAYLGLLLYRHHGFITNSGPAYDYLDEMAVITTGYKVEDVNDQGCRIAPLAGSSMSRDNDIFVVGMTGAYSGRTYSDILMVRKVGSYSYKTVAGASRRIPKYDSGERVSNAEYTEFFWKKRTKGGGRGSDDISPTPENAAGRSGGTGFFVTDDGYFVTCEHVVRGATSFHVKSPSGSLPARLIKKDRTSDLAVLKVDGAFRALPVDAKPSVKLGETVFTIGFPNPVVQGVEPKLTRGEISSMAGIRDNPRYYQISVPVQPGNSGGALVNESGNAVGVVTSRLDDIATYQASGALPQNINYAVKSDLLYNFLSGVPELSGKLKTPGTARNRDAASGAAEGAAVLVEAE